MVLEVTVRNGTIVLDQAPVLPEGARVEVVVKPATDPASLTTAWVLTEVADAMSDPKNRQEFMSTLEDLRQSPAVTIVPPDCRLFDEAVEFYGRRADKAWSLTDCTSFLVMQRQGSAKR